MERRQREAESRERSARERELLRACFQKSGWKRCLGEDEKLERFARVSL